MICVRPVTDRPRLARRQLTRVVAIAAALSLCLVACEDDAAVDHGLTIPKDVPRTARPFFDDPEVFQFVIVADRTGGHRPGVFAAAMEKINLLRPEFVMSVGDVIEGYTDDEATLLAQWDELDALVAKLQMPFFHTVGNHDSSNEQMRALWRKRNGRDYYHFVYKDVLFLSLNTEDPPIALTENELAGQARLVDMMAKDPVGTQQHLLEHSEPRVPGGQKPQPSDVAISEQQVRYFAEVLQEHAGVRWTMVFMHKPAWETDNGQFRQIEAMLGDRPYTVIAGHEHYYSHTQRNGRDYLVLGTTGGVWINQGPGNMDHLTWITMTSDGPAIGIIRLDGLLDKYGPQ